MRAALISGKTIDVKPTAASPKRGTSLGCDTLHPGPSTQQTHLFPLCWAGSPGSRVVFGWKYPSELSKYHQRRARVRRCSLIRQWGEFSRRTRVEPEPRELPLCLPAFAVLIHHHHHLPKFLQTHLSQKPPGRDPNVRRG